MKVYYVVYAIASHASERSKLFATKQKAEVREKEVREAVRILGYQFTIEPAVHELEVEE